MALTPSTMLALGTPLPAFRLPDPAGKWVSSDDFAGAPLLVMILCNHCPYVKRVADDIARFARDYRERGLASVAINANDAEKYPDDAPAKMAEEAARRGYGFPYLYDESQAVAKAFRAACTPEFNLFDRSGRLAYRGRFDDLRAAADAVLAGRTPSPDQRASIGCSIKWKPDNDPDYL